MHLMDAKCLGEERVAKDGLINPEAKLSCCFLMDILSSVESLLC